jgi:tungstate transport system substrate-binding protein
MTVAAPRPVVLATTTSVNDTGLLDFILPEFQRRTGIEVKVVAVGSGQAIELARRGDADAVLSHAPDLEREFVRQGNAAGRWRLMYNHFMIVGLAADPAQVRAAPTAVAAMRRIAEARAPFVSRGDESGTHQRERSLWRRAGIRPKGDWYLEAGAGMAATLRLADERGAYTLTDNGTFLAQRAKLRLTTLCDKDSDLVNRYSLMAVSPQAHPGVNYDGAMRLIGYLRAPETVRRIAAFGVERYGRPLFQVYPPAKQQPASLPPTAGPAFAGDNATTNAVAPGCRSAGCRPCRGDSSVDDIIQGIVVGQKLVFCPPSWAGGKLLPYG